MGCLGDKVGLPGCKGRRTWIKKVAMGAFAATVAPPMIKAHQITTGNTAIHPLLARGFVRTMNTSQVGDAIHNGGVFKDRTGFLEGLLHHQAHTELGSSVAVYMSKLGVWRDKDNPNIIHSDFENIIPGWRLIWDGNPTGYKLRLEQKDGPVTFDTSDEGVITAEGLDAENARMSRYLRVAYRMRVPDLCSGCKPTLFNPVPKNNCAYCVTNCCSATCTIDRPPLTWDFFNCGGPSSGPNACVWGGVIAIDCEPTMCADIKACAADFFQTCVYCNHSC